MLRLPGAISWEHKFKLHLMGPEESQPPWQPVSPTDIWQLPWPWLSETPSSAANEAPPCSAGVVIDLPAPSIFSGRALRSLRSLLVLNWDVSTCKCTPCSEISTDYQTGLERRLLQLISATAPSWGGPMPGPYIALLYREGLQGVTIYAILQYETSPNWTSQKQNHWFDKLFF